MKDDKLPVDKSPDGILIVPVPGMCIGGTVDPNIQALGYLVFTRSDGSQAASVKRFLHQAKTNEDFINTIRKSKFNYDSTSGEEVPPIATAVAWHDGASDQLECTNIQNTERIHCNKHSGARTSIEQPEDGSTKYPMIKKGLATTSHFRTDHDQKSTLQVNLESQLHELKLEGKLILSKNHSETVVCTAVSLPDVLTKAMTTEGLQCGYISSGMLDKTTKRSPDLLQIIVEQVKREVPQAEVDNIIKHFPHLLKIQLNRGQVTDQDMSACGIANDIDSKGNHVSRDVAITQENFQRAKTLNHPFQKAQRETDIFSITASLEKKRNVEIA